MLRVLRAMTITCALLPAVLFGAGGARLNLDINSPPAVVLRHNMAQRLKYLLPYYVSGAIGIARDGSVQLREAERVPERVRLALANDIEKENDARSDLAREIARANGVPQRVDEVRALLAGRWIAHAQPGWWVQDERGRWVRK
ncbi:MAG: hypothetical protein OHK0026_04890 [Rhodocyclaceae bacterium]